MQEYYRFGTEQNINESVERIQKMFVEMLMLKNLRGRRSQTLFLV